MNSNYPKCCEEWGLNSRVFKNDKWAHQWSTPITQLGKEGYEPCVFDGPTEQLAGFHAVNGLHFQLWKDGVSVLLFDPEEGFSLLALVPLSIWGSVLLAATPQVTLKEILTQYGAHHIRDWDALNKWKKLPCDCGFAALVKGTSEQASLREFKPYMEDHEYYDPPQAPPTPEEFPSRSQEKRIRTMRSDKKPLDPRHSKFKND